MAKYLDLGGLSALWAKIKAALSKKQDALENAGDKSTPVYISGGKAVPVDFVDSPSVGTGTNPVNGGRYFYAVNDHTHANKSVLDGITAADIDAWNLATDNSYSLTGGSGYNYGVFLCRTDSAVGSEQIFSVSCLVLIRTLENAAAFVLNVCTHGTSRKYSLTQVDGTTGLSLRIALVALGTSGNAQYRYGVYLYTTSDQYNYWSVRIVPWRTTYVVWGPELCDKATRDNLKTSAYQSDAVIGTDKLKIDGSNATAAGVSAAINKLTTGTSAPTDADYYVSQYSGGGTSTTTYHRRPVSALFTYIKSKLGSVGGTGEPVYFSNGMPVKCSLNIPAPVSAVSNVVSNSLNGKGLLYSSGSGSATTTQAETGMCWSNGSKYFTVVAGSGTVGGKAYFGADNNSESNGSVEVVSSAIWRASGNVGTMIINVKLNPRGGGISTARYPVKSQSGSSITVDKTLSVDSANTLMFRLNTSGGLTGWSGFGQAMFVGNIGVFVTLDANRHITISSTATFSSFAANQDYTMVLNLIK